MTDFVPPNCCRNIFILFWIFAFSWKGLHCYGAGAPMSVCLGHHTSHEGIKPQISPVPFQIYFSSDTYMPSQEIRVTLSSPSNEQFKGFLIVAHRTIADQEKAVGIITTFSEEKAKIQGCVYDEDVVLTHKNNNTVNKIEFSWRAPDSDQGDIIFKYMVVADFTTYWIDQRSPLLKSTTPLAYVPPHVEQETFDMEDIDWGACGVTKGCFLYPRTCTGSDCTAAMTYRAQGDTFVIEMFAAKQEQIAVGFSNDKLMGKDHVHACTGAYGMLSVQNGYNPLTYYMRNYRTELSDMSVKNVNGNIQCRLTRPRSMTVFSEIEGNVAFDLNNNYYLFLAWGDVYTNTDVLVHHYVLPAITDHPVNFFDNKIVGGSALHILVQVHGILMFIAWMLFVGVTTIVSRYYKDGFSRKLACGTKWWFQIHRACGILAWCLTAAAFIIIFIRVQGLSKLAELHSYLGIAVMSACTLQVLAGVLRPGLESTIRPVFNIGHLLLGKSCHILAAASFYLAYYSDIIDTKQREFGVIVISVWLGTQVTWEIIFEVTKCCRSHEAPDSYEMSEKTSHGVYPADDTKQQTTPSRTDCILLIVYVICLLGLLAAAILSVILF